MKDATNWNWLDPIELVWTQNTTNLYNKIKQLINGGGGGCTTDDLTRRLEVFWSVWACADSIQVHTRAFTHTVFMAIVYIVFINFYYHSFFPYLSITLAAVMCNLPTRYSKRLILFHSYAHVHAHAACIFEKRTHVHASTHT